jgi:3-oxoacyl-[acyl-carrier-protein] synthase-1
LEDTYSNDGTIKAMNKKPGYISSLGIINALGCGKAEVARRLFSGDTSGVILEDGWLPNSQARVGKIVHDLPEIRESFGADNSRNNRLLLAAVEEIRTDIQQEIQRWGSSRIGVVLGTSTSGIGEGESAVQWNLDQGVWPEGYHYRKQEIGRIATFLSEYLELAGPAFTVSTACTSSGRALMSARNLLRHDLCDAVITGGVDSLCKLTVNGFSALEAISQDICNPMSINRNGINIGEGAALFILRREPSHVKLMGAGESSDAFHISSPDPQGRGAKAAMRAALEDAFLMPEELNYVNLHATATLKNDEMESQAMDRIFPNSIPCSGTKPLTGHTLGAAGAIELAFCWLTINREFNPELLLPPHRWDGEVDPSLPDLSLVKEGDMITGDMSRIVCMSNSFAFGGSNVSLIIGTE